MAQIVSILKGYPIAVLCCFVALICSGVTYSRGGGLTEFAEKEEELAARQILFDRNAEKASGLGDDLTNLELLVEQIDERLFDRDQRAININFFYALEDETPVRITKISQTGGGSEFYGKGGTRALSRFLPVGYNLTVEGSFSGILEFIHTLHNVKPLIRIENFRIETGGMTGNAGILEARLKIVALARK